MNDDELNRRIANLVKAVPPPASTGRWRQASLDRSGNGVFVRWFRSGLPGPLKSLGVLAALAATVTTATVSVALTVGHQHNTPPSPAVAAVVPTSVVSAPTPAPPTNQTAPQPVNSPAPSAAPQSTPAPQTTTTPAATPAPTPVGPAFPNPPLITLDGHGGFILNGTGSDWWHLAYNTVNQGAGLAYSYPDIPASTTDITIPAQYRCVSVQATKGGDQYPGHPNRASGTWSQWFCN